MTPKPLPPIELLREQFNYDPETGVLTNKISGYTGCKRLQKESSTRRPSGIYITLVLNGKNDSFWWAAHRIAAALSGMSVDPSVKVDHISGNAWDNRLVNLRIATHSQNIMNSASRRDKKDPSIPKGVTFDPHNKKGLQYKAGICFNQKKIYLGRFPTKEEAHAAYCAAAMRYFGDFARFE